MLLNSHDKSSACQLHCGLFRLVCSNGIVVADATFQRISIKHFGFNPDSVIEVVPHVGRTIDSTVKAINAGLRSLKAGTGTLGKVAVIVDRDLVEAS